MKHTLSVRWRQLLLTVRLCHHLSHACSVSEWPVDSQTFRASFCTSCTVSPGVVITPVPRDPRHGLVVTRDTIAAAVRAAVCDSFSVAAHVKMRDDGWMGLLRCLAPQTSCDSVCGVSFTIVVVGLGVTTVSRSRRNRKILCPSCYCRACRPRAYRQ